MFNISRASFLNGVETVFPSMSAEWLLVKLIYYVVIVVISTSVMAITPHKKMFVLTKVGQKTMQIYFWHIIVRSFIFYTGIQNYFYASFVGNIAWAIISTMIAVALTLKLFEFPTKYIQDGVRNLQKK